MSEKKIIQQKNGFMIYEDNTKISIKEYREKMKLSKKEDKKFFKPDQK